MRAMIDKSLQELLHELEDFGQKNDRSVFDRPRRMLNITRDTGEFLFVIILATSAKRILEIMGSEAKYDRLVIDAADGEFTYEFK